MNSDIKISPAEIVEQEQRSLKLRLGLSQRFCRLGLPQQITIGLRLGLNVNGLKYGHPIDRGRVLLAQVNDRDAWTELAPLLDRAEIGAL